MSYTIFLQEEHLAGYDNPVAEAYKSALENSAKVSITDQDGIILYVNPKFCEICQYEPWELIGQTHKVLNSGFHEPVFFQNLWNTIAAGMLWKGEICNKAKDGSLYWVDTVIVPFRENEHGERRYLSLRFDITGKKRAEERLRISEALLRVRNEELEELQSQREETIDFVAHELKSPLNNLDLLAELLEEELSGAENPDLQEISRQMQIITQKMLYMIKSFLDAKNPESRLSEPCLEFFNLYRLAEMIIRDVTIKAATKNVQVFLSGNDVQMTVYADMDLVAHVLENLINNALHYTPSGKNVRIHLEKIHEQTIIRCKIQDEGPGIKQEELELLFTRYGILSTKALRHEYSTGLGLFITKKIVESMNGKICCKSEEGQGATFILELPTGNTMAVAGTQYNPLPPQY